MKQPAPFRFLVVVVGSWIAFRLVVLLPTWSGNAQQAPSSGGLSEADQVEASESARISAAPQTDLAVVSARSVAVHPTFARKLGPFVRLAHVEEAPRMGLLSVAGPSAREPAATSTSNLLPSYPQTRAAPT